MSLREIIASGGGALLILMTLIQIAPIKVNPWSAIARAIGRCLNSDVLKELADVKKQQQDTQTKLDAHVEMDDKREANRNRADILRFNNELVRDIGHTKEEFIDILSKIDEYESYCQEHPKYENSRAVHAIANIGKVYDERLEKHDFL